MREPGRTSFALPDYLNKLLPLVRRGGLVVAHDMRVPRPDPRYVISRSLLSFLSSAVNLLAGACRYRLRVFLLFSILGRMIWTFAIADFPSSLSGLLASLGVLPRLGFMLYRNHAHLRVA